VILTCVVDVSRFFGVRLAALPAQPAAGVAAPAQ